MFNFDDVKYIKGVNNPVGDELSRPPLRPVQVNVTEGELHSIVTLCDMQITSTTNNLRERIEQALLADKEFGQIYGLLTSSKYNQATSEFRLHFTVKDKLLFWMFKSGLEPQICVPKSIRALLLREHHDVYFCGHMGIDRTYLSLSKDYYWKYMYNDVKLHINSCSACQTNKPSNQRPAGLLRPLQIPLRPFQTVRIDMVTGLPPDIHGNNTTVVFTCHTTHAVLFEATVASTDPRDAANPLSATKLAELYLRVIFRRYGLCDVIISDCDPRFVSTFWQAFHKLCDTRLGMSTAFHPQSDGATERANRTYIESICTILSVYSGAWTDHLSYIEFAMNNSHNASTKMTPFELLLGYKPRVPASLDDDNTVQSTVSKRLERLNVNLKQAHDNVMRAQIRMIKTADMSSRASTFKVGDSVYVSTKNLALVRPNKFKPKYIGPFLILKMKAFGNAAQLALSPDLVQRQLHDIFNVDLLKLYVPRPSHLGPPIITNPPPLCEDTSGMYYALDFILEKQKHATSKGTPKLLHYLCRWQGYGAAGDTWEPATVINADSLEAMTMAVGCFSYLAIWRTSRQFFWFHV
jgi:hypothetical protein